MGKATLIWNCANTREVLPSVATPLSQQVLRRVIDYGARQFMADAGVIVETKELFTDFHHGRLYLNINFLMDTASKIPGRTPRNVAATLGFEDMDLVVEYLGVDPDRTTSLNLKTIKPMFGTIKFLLRMPGLVRRRMPQIRADLERLTAEVERAEDEKGLMDLLHQIEKTTLDAAWLHGGVGNFSLGMWESLERIVAKYFDQAETQELLSDMTGGLEGMITAEISLAVRDLALLAEQDQQIREAFLQDNPLEVLRGLRERNPAHSFFRAWDEFMLKYGHRTFDELELIHPRWHQDPTYLARVIRGYLRHPAGPPKGVMSRREARRQKAIATVKARLSWLDKIPFNFLLDIVQFYSVQRENTKDLWMLGFYGIRSVHVALARRWVERGWLEKEEDVFFLRPEEIEQVVAGGLEGSELGPVVQERRAEYAYNQSLSPPETIIDYWEPTESAAAVEAVEEEVGHATLSGLACSGGQVTGTARVILDPVVGANRLSPGDIIVTVQTDPMWTTLFLHAGAVVTERGGILSHAAIVAREFGIPAVVGVEGATRRIADGLTIVVDGTAGTVEVLGTYRSGRASQILEQA